VSAQNRRPLIAGNWKMHNTIGESVTLARAIADGSRIGPRTDVVVAPVFTALAAVSDALRGTRVAVSGQDVYWEDKGAFTGQVSAPMLKDAGCTYGIVGHSERRQFFGETDDTVARKVTALRNHGITPIACIGETLKEREGGITFEVVRRQLEAILAVLDEQAAGEIVIAYEPVWAIGTGKTAKASDAQQVHAYCRDRIAHQFSGAAGSTRILYGGSVKPDNAAELLAQPDIDGALVGGASLDAAGFARIIQAAG
jgi:triosephosphate isomerase